MPKAYLRIERSRSKLASAENMAEDEENVLLAGDALREADVEAAKSASETDIFVPETRKTDTPDSGATKSAAGTAQNDSCSGGSRVSVGTLEPLESLSIDDLRALACTLKVHDRSRMTEKDELIAEIRKRL